MVKNKKSASVFLQKTDELLTKTLFFVYVFAMGVVLPLHYRNGYSDLMEAKADLFVSMMKWIFPFMAILFAIRIIRRRIKITFINSILLAFLLSVSVSTVFSFSPHDAISGRQGWYVGFYAILCFLLALFLFKDEDVTENKIIYVPLIPVYLLQLILTFADAMGYDLLSIRENLPDYYRLTHFATIGNSNWYVGYLSLFVPFFTALYLFSKEKILTAVCLLLSVNGFIASILIGADAMLVVLLCTVAFLFPFILDSIVRLRRFLVFVLSFLLCVLIIDISGQFANFLWLYRGIGKLFFEYPAINACIAIMSALLLIFLFKLDESTYQEKKKVIKLTVSIALLLIILFLGFKFIDKAGNYDSNRIALWELSFDKYSQFGLYHKMFGLGPELLRNLYSSMFETFGTVYTVSHSEPIQILLSMGAFGSVFWFLCWAYVIWVFFQRSIYRDHLSSALFVSLLSYLIQSFFNSATIPNLGILIIVLCYFSRRASNEKH